MPRSRCSYTVAPLGLLHATGMHPPDAAILRSAAAAAALTSSECPALLALVNSSKKSRRRASTDFAFSTAVALPGGALEGRSCCCLRGVKGLGLGLKSKAATGGSSPTAAAKTWPLANGNNHRG